MGREVAEQLVAAVADRDIDAYVELFADNAVMYHPLMPDGVRGREEIRAGEAELFEAFSDIQVEVRSLLEGDGATAIEVVLRATNSGPLNLGEGEPLPPTGRRIELPSVWVLELDGEGKVVEERDYFNAASFMEQLGLTE